MLKFYVEVRNFQRNCDLWLVQEPTPGSDTQAHLQDMRKIAFAMLEAANIEVEKP